MVEQIFPSFSSVRTCLISVHITRLFYVSQYAYAHTHIHRHTRTHAHTHAHTRTRMALIDYNLGPVVQIILAKCREKSVSVMLYTNATFRCTDYMKKELRDRDVD